MAIDRDPRRRAILVRSRQDTDTFIEGKTRHAISRFFETMIQRRLSGGTLSSAELAIVDDYNRRFLFLAAVETQTRALQLDPTKTELDYVPIDPMVTTGPYTQPSFWTTIPWSTSDELEAEMQARQDADADLQQQINAIELTPGPKGDKGDRGDKGDSGNTGPKGDRGNDGNALLHGAGAPMNTLGMDGDFYYDTTHSAIYGPKSAGAWGDGASAIGPQGAAGVRGSKFLGSYSNSASLPAVDGSTVMAGDYAYVLDAGELWRAS